MKKIVIALFLTLFTSFVNAKQVKFAVDMTTNTISPNGIHLIGDLQEAASYGPNWDPAKMKLTQEGNTSIYSIVVNIPAFKKYEYKYVNGDQTYEAEFVPDESRVSFDIDNRWVYVDSVTNDVTFFGAMVFGGNAPAGKFLIRYKLNTNHMGVIPPNGFHVGTSYSSFDPNKNRLYSFGKGIYEIIDYATAATYGYKYYNGNTLASAETVPNACSVSGNRSLVLTKDTVLPAVCFSECLACADVGVKEIATNDTQFNIYPNPANTRFVTINFKTNQQVTISVYDLTGRHLINFIQVKDGDKLDFSNFHTGVYFLKFIGNNSNNRTGKLIIE